MLGREEGRAIVGGGGGGGGGERKPGGKKFTSAELRLVKDQEELDGYGATAVCTPKPDQITEMSLKIAPEMGYWKGGSFDFTISVPAEYPIKPPKVLCKTKIYHPNIDLEGHVCLNILRDDWRPSLTINHIVLGMLTLFYEPNDKDPLNKDAAEVMRTNEREFRRNVLTSLNGGSVKGEKFPKLL